MDELMIKIKNYLINDYTPKTIDNNYKKRYEEQEQKTE